MKKEKKEYQRPSIEVIEAEVQQPIAASPSSSMKINSWEPEPEDGTIDDI